MSKALRVFAEISGIAFRASPQGEAANKRFNIISKGLNLTRRSLVLGLPAALIFPPRRAMASDQRLGLIFVGQSTCPYCQSLAPILGSMSDAGVADVMLASMDRRPLPPFFAYQDGLTHPLTRDFRTVPQVLVYNPRHDDVTHIISGVRNMRRFVLRLSHAMRQSAAL